MAQNFNPWISMAKKIAPNGLGILPEAQSSQIDDIQQIFGTTPMGKPTPAGFVPNPTPRGNQPQVVPPPQPKKPPFDPFSGVEDPLNYVDEVPAVMDEMSAMPELDIQLDDGPNQMLPDYAPEEPQISDEKIVDEFIPEEVAPPQQELTAQPTTTPLGVIPKEITPQQPSLMSDPEGADPEKVKFSKMLDIAIGNLSDKQNMAQDEVYNMKEALNRYVNESGNGIDFTPLAALSDAWFGGNLTAAAKEISPPSNAERLKTINDLQARIADAQTGLTKDQLETIKMKVAQESYGLQRENALKVAKIQAEARKAMAGNAGIRAGIAQDNLASRAADVVDKDPLVKKYYDMSEQADRDVALLSTPLLTYQNLNEVQIGLARVIAGGGQAAVSREEKTEFKTLGLELANLKQKLTGQPQDVASPEIVAQLKHIGDRLKSGLQKNAYNRAKKLAEGRGKVYKNNPIAAEVLKDKVESYKPVPIEETPASGGLSPEKKARLEELRQKLGK